MTRIFSKHLLLPLALLMMSCSGQVDTDPAIPQDHLQGEYFSAPCPPLTYYDGTLGFAGRSINADLVRKKQDNLLEADQTIHFVEDEDGCRFVVIDEPRFYDVNNSKNDVSIKIRSADLKRYRLFKRSTR